MRSSGKYINVLFYKNILMLEYENVYFRWLEDIRQYKYFLQSLLTNVCNRNLFSRRHFETSSDILFKSSFWFGYMSMANFSWRHIEHRFVCFCMMEQFELFSALMLVFPFSLYFPNITGIVRIVLVSKWLGVVIISLLFKLTLCMAKIHFFGLECC